MNGAYVQRRAAGGSAAHAVESASGSGSAVQRSALRGMSFAEGAAALSPVQKKDAGTQNRSPEEFADAVVHQMEHAVGHLSGNQLTNLRRDAIAAKKADPAADVVKFVLERKEHYMAKK
ncbi:MAG: hypothetical protein H6745_05675 [Deltaproteobacteria bacterium]|nr:hypothetical protein [Deltaproteobacteria bacterium]